MKMSKTTEQNVTAWDVKGAEIDGVLQAIDYNKLVNEFGSTLITPELLERFENVTGRKPHRFLRRGIFFSHRDLNLILDLHEKGKPFYLYTGRGPSSDSLHCGHMVPFIFCQWLQDVFDVPIVIQMTDDEKYLVKDMDFNDAARYTRGNLTDIIALGFKEDKTFVFQDTEYIEYLLPNIMKVQQKISINDSYKTFGFSQDDPIGKFGFPPVQIAPCFSNTFPHIYGTKKDIPCLIPCAIDQDVYFRLTRNIASALKYQKPALVHAKFFPALQGAETKMSASDASSSIYVCDDADLIRHKVYTYAKVTDRKDPETGLLDIDNDIPISYLRFFLEDDHEMKQIEEDYKYGNINAEAVKEKLVIELQKFIVAFQEKRKLITPETLDLFMSIRDMTGAVRIAKK